MLLWQCSNRLICKSYDFQLNHTIIREEANPLNIGKSIIRIDILAIGFLQVAMMYKISAEIQNIKGQITYSRKRFRKHIFYSIQLILVISYTALEICTFAVDWWTIGNSNNLHAVMVTALFVIYLGTLVYTQ